MVLPLFSERNLTDFLGINLIVDNLRKQGHEVDCLDLNVALVDFILTEKTILQKIGEAKVSALGGSEKSPYHEYLQYYFKFLGEYENSAQLKESRLYDYFFQSVILESGGGGFSNQAVNLDGNLQLPEEQLGLAEFFTFSLGRFKESAYEAVLVSIPHYNQLGPGLVFVRKLKTLCPEMKIIIGGSTITLLDDQVLLDYVKNGYFDYYIKYTAEEKLTALLAALAEDTGVDQEWLANKLDTDIDSQIMTYRPEQDRSAVPILFSRGCYWGKCSYCTYIQLDSGKFTRKSLTVLLDELAQFSGKPVRISLITESLTPTDARSLAEGILKRGIKVRWGSFIRVNTHFDKELFSLLRESGCIFSCVGVESVNDKILTFFNKGYKCEDVYKFFQAASDADYRFYQVNFIYGAPVATLSDELENLDFISSFRKTIGNIAFFKFEITEHTHLAENLDKYEIKLDPQSSAAAVRVGNIPFVYSLSEKDMNLLEQAYARAGYHFVAQDVKLSIKALQGVGDKPLPLSGAVLFSQDEQFYLGSLRTPFLAPISPDLFQALSQTPKPPVKEFSEANLKQFFELKLLDREATFWATFAG